MINDYVDDSRKTWLTINDVNTSRESNRSAINQLDYKRDTITSCCGIAEAFNDYFCGIALGLLVMIRSGFNLTEIGDSYMLSMITKLINLKLLV